MTNKHLIHGILIITTLLLHTGCGKKSDDAAGSDKSGILPNTLKVERFSKEYEITGIGIKGKDTVAIINGEVVVPGTELDPGVVLKSVEETFATILVGNTEYKIRPEDIQKKLLEK